MMTDRGADSLLTQQQKPDHCPATWATSSQLYKYSLHTKQPSCQSPNPRMILLA